MDMVLLYLIDKNHLYIFGRLFSPNI